MVLAMPIGRGLLMTCEPGGQWWSMGVLALLNGMRVKCHQQQLKRQQSKSKLEMRILTPVTKCCSGNANRQCIIGNRQCYCSCHVGLVVIAMGEEESQTG